MISSLFSDSHERNTLCTNQWNCAGGVFRSQTARPEYNGIDLVSVYKGKIKGKLSIFMAADLREMQENQGLSEKPIDKFRFSNIGLHIPFVLLPSIWR